MESNEISFIDVLKNIIRRWRLLLVCALIGLVVSIIIGVYSNISYNNSLNNRKSDNQDDIENLTFNELVNYTNLTDSQISDVKNAVKAFNLIEEYNSYAGEGYESNRVYSSSKVMQYIISANSTDNGLSSDLVSNILQSLEQYINSSGMAKNIEITSNGQLAFGDIKNCIFIKYDFSRLNATSNNINALRSMTFYITCKGKNMESVDMLTELVKKEISSYGQKFSSYGTCSIKLVDSYEGGIKDSVTMTTDLSDVTAILTAKTTFSNITKAFNEEQSALFNSLVHKNVLATKHSITGAVIYTESKPVDITNGLVMNSILGVVAGLFIACVIASCEYMLSGTVKKKEDLISAFGYYCLGNAKLMSDKSGFGSNLDKYIARNDEEIVYSHEDRIELLLSNIRAVCKKNQTKEVIMASTAVINENNKSIISRIIKSLKDMEIDASFEGNVLTSVTGFDQMTEVKNLVLIEKIGESKYKNLEEISNITKEYDVNVLGFISI